MRKACEQAKRALSSQSRADIEIDSMWEGLDFFTSITRAKFEELCADLFGGILEPIENSLRDAKLDKTQIEEIVLVGGSTRIPKVQSLLQDFFDGKELNKSINPDEAVAYGAAVQAAILAGVSSETLKDILLLDVTPYTLGVQTVDGESLGMDDKNGVMKAIIKHNTTIPTKQTRVFLTKTADQPRVLIRVLEGESVKTEENNLLGEFELTGISPDIADIVVTFEINANDILNVCAVDGATGNGKSVIMTNDASHLSKREVERMTVDAQTSRLDDQRNCERIKAKNSLETVKND